MQVAGRAVDLNEAAQLTAEAQTLGTSVTPFAKGGLGGVPTAILNPRMLRLAVQFKF